MRAGAAGGLGGSGAEEDLATGGAAGPPAARPSQLTPALARDVAVKFQVMASRIDQQEARLRARPAPVSSSMPMSVSTGRSNFPVAACAVATLAKQTWHSECTACHSPTHDGSRARHCHGGCGGLQGPVHAQRHQHHRWRTCRTA
jgi:hypothetical protein